MEYTFSFTITHVHIWQFIIIGGFLGTAYAVALNTVLAWLDRQSTVATTIGVGMTLALLWLFGGIPFDFVVFLAGAFAVTGGIPNLIRMVYNLDKRQREEIGTEVERAR